MTSPLDPEFLKIPAFQRKKIIQKRIQAPPQFTVGDAMRSAARDEVYEDPMISSSFSRAKESAREASRFSQQNQQFSPATPVPTQRKRAITSKPRDVQSRAFGSISLQQPSLLHYAPEASAPSSYALRSYDEIGVVTAILNKIQVVIIKLSTTLKSGEILLFETDGQMFEEKAESIQVDRKNVKTAKKNTEIGMKISHLPRNGSKVYRVKLK